MIEARRYRDGVADPEPVDCSDLSAARGGPGTLLIVETADFSDAELEQLATQLPIHPLAVEDLENAHQRTKLQQYDDHWHVAVHEADTHDHTLTFREVDVVFGQDWLLAVRQPVAGGRPMDLDEVRERFRRMRAVHQGDDLGLALWALLDVIVDCYFEVTDIIDERLDAIEEIIFGGQVHDATPKEVFELRRKLVELRRSAAPIREVVSTMLRHEVPWIRDASEQLLQDVNDHALRLNELVETQRELLTGLLEAHLAIVSNRMNDVMKRTSSYGAILLVSTLIAGIYGMNFKYMPELDLRYGYFFALGTMAIATVILWVQFKKRGWL